MIDRLPKLLPVLSACVFALWLGLRWLAFGTPLVLGVDTPEGTLPFLFLDLSVVPFVACAALWWRCPPSERAARMHVAAMTLLLLVHGAGLALLRYYRGDALAWDMGNFVQPMWRAMQGEGMVSSWHADRPLWGDHGSFALFLFAPFTLLFGDAATGVLLVQAALTAAFLPALYAFARAVALPTSAALLIVAATFVSRPLSYAMTFDFHPECALPLLLTLILLAHQRKNRWLLVLSVLLAASLKDMAALITGATCSYLAARDRDKRAAVLALVSFGVAALDIALLPKLTGWASYVAMNTSAPVDAALAAKTSAMRALSTGLMGSLHPLGLITGMPWALASGMSAKLLVKGVQFQYGYLFVGSALLGAVLASVWLLRRQRLALLSVLWAVGCVAVNAPRGFDLGELSIAHGHFEEHRALLAGLTRPDDSIATDACSAASMMEHVQLLPLCQIDTQRLASGGTERWDVPDPRALSASLILLRPSCALHGACLRAQVESAVKQGYRIVAKERGMVALRRSLR